MKRLFKRVLFRILVILKLYPHVFIVGQPGKIYEFCKLLKDVKFSGQETVMDFGCGY